MRVEVFAESAMMYALQKGGSVVAGGFATSEFLMTLVQGADREQGFGGKLLDYVRSHGMPEVLAVDGEMGDEWWNSFLCERYGTTDWIRWFARGSATRIRFNIVIKQSPSN